MIIEKPSWVMTLESIGGSVDAKFGLDEDEQETKVTDFIKSGKKQEPEPDWWVTFEAAGGGI